MKKMLVVVVFLLAMATVVFAEGIDLGKFPKGKWLDANWNAVWEFGANSIRLLDTNGGLIFDFQDKIEDLKVDVGVGEAKISFACEEAGRKYVFTKGITDLDLEMTIDPDWSAADYTVTMKMQK